MGSNSTHKGHKATPGLLKALRSIERKASSKGHRRRHRISRRLRRKANFEFQKQLLACLD
jgi:hypothetical protein